MNRIFVIAVALSALGLIPIAAYAQGEIDIVQSITGLIAALGFFKSKNLIKEGDQELYNKIILGAEGMQGSDRRIQENVEKITPVAA